MRVAIETLGCKVNQYESERIMRELAGAGFTHCSFDLPCDVYIINTCAVTATADAKSRRLVKAARRRNPAALVVALGCSAQVGASLAEADLVLDNAQKKEAAAKIIALAGEKPQLSAPAAPYKGDRTRAYIKIGDGCNNFCAYCIIPYARGRVASRPIAKLAEEFEAAVNLGYREVVVTAIEIASFGLDSGEKLIDLLRRFDETAFGRCRVRLGSLDPRLMTNEFIELLASLKSLCPHFHISLQSGSDSVLSRMRRRYTTADYYDAVTALRRAFGQKTGITTDIIVGFPGESEREFLQTAAFVDKVGFSRTHLFPYSRRRGTPAAEMPEQIPKSVKSERLERLRIAAEASAARFAKSLVGQQVEILAERALREGVYEGYSENYMLSRVSMPSGGHENEIVRALVSGADGAELICRCV